VSRAYVDGEWVAGDVTIDGDMIDAIGMTPAGTGGSAVPGFVDLQVNGFAGVSFTTCDRQGFGVAATAIARHGVTSFLPTIPTAAPDRYADALAAAADVVDDPPPGARSLGVHLEGPFLSPQRPGAHNPGWLRPPDLATAQRLVAAAPVALMTLAPELEGAKEVIDLLRRRGTVISAGHTDATAAEAHVAFDAGVTKVTHLWNAQRQITSREPGLAGVALTRRDVFVGLIADLVHLSAETLALSLAAAGPRAVVVTDAAWAAGLPEGTHHLDGHDVVVGDGAVRLPDGTLAGASVGLDDCVRNVVSVGESLEAALHAVTTAPAAVLRHPDLGRLAPGGRADVVVLDDALTITRVLVGGVEVT
jgi:N-acetylglucosamine-6-phosphate deacetylase